jgi:hypothetical protein
MNIRIEELLITFYNVNANTFMEAKHRIMMNMFNDPGNLIPKANFLIPNKGDIYYFPDIDDPYIVTDIIRKFQNNGLCIQINVSQK